MLNPKRHATERSHHAEPDDYDVYLAELDAETQQRIADAGEAIDIATMLHRARTARGLTQTEAANLAGLQQQAVSRLEQIAHTPRLDRVATYLAALGYDLEIRAIDRETGDSPASVVLSAGLRSAD